MDWLSYDHRKYIPIAKRGTWNRTFLTEVNLTKNNKAYALFKIIELIFICYF